MTFQTRSILRPAPDVRQRAEDYGQETVLHCLSNNNNRFKKTKKLSYGTVSAMCFVFILTENKWYIFLKKEKETSHWKGLRNSKRGDCSGEKRLNRTDSLPKQIKNESSDLRIVPRSLPQSLFRALSTQAQNAYLADFSEAFLSDLERNIV